MPVRVKDPAFKMASKKSYTVSLSSVNYVHASGMMPVPTFGRIKLARQLNLPAWEKISNFGVSHQFLLQFQLSPPFSGMSYTDHSFF